MHWLWRVADHTIELDWSFWTGRKRLVVDGQRKDLPGGLFAARTEVPLELGSERATLVFQLRFLALAMGSLLVAGRPVAPVVAPHDVPWWTWPFVVAIAGIFVATVGGALWGALIGVGAVSCIGAARMPWPAATRLLVLAAITAGCWGVYFGIRAQL